MSETVIEEIENGVAVFTLNRPEQRNAFNNQMWNELRMALVGARENDDVRAVIVTGAGRAFSAGQDLGEMARPSVGGASEHGFSGFMDCLGEFDKPLLAAVNGVGVGIGLTLLLHCDVSYMAEGARLRPPFVTLGVVPEAASSYLLPQLVGYHRAAEIFFSADWIDAPRALELGIVSRVLPSDELLPTLREKADHFAAQAPESLRHTKRLLMATRNDGIRAARAREDAAFEIRVGSPENVEAIKAFFEKRTPDFASLRSDGSSSVGGS